MKNTQTKRGFTKVMALLLTFMLILGMMPAMAFADEGADGVSPAEGNITVHISISKYGEFVTGKDGTEIVYVPIDVSDSNKNGIFDIDDVFAATHSKYFLGGLASGYEVSDGQYGAYVSKLWGDTSGNFGYQVNGGTKSVMSLNHEVNEGDSIDGCIYQNTYPNTEVYTAFANNEVVAAKNEAVEFQLKQMVFDENYTPSMIPIEDVVITKNGEETSLKTDAEGKASLVFSEAGIYIISGKKSKTLDTETTTAITAPVCIVNVIEPIQVRISAQKETSFTYMPKIISVSYGIAKKYGYENASTVAEGTITALDALVAAHVEAYGDSFTKETSNSYLALSYGNPTKSFNDATEGFYSGFAVNHSYYMDSNKQGYNVNSAPLKEGDIVDFFYYEDEYWRDTLTWFETVDGKIVEEISAEKDEQIQLKLKGFMFMSGYASPSPISIYNEDEMLSLYTIGTGNDVCATDSENLGEITNEDGNITIVFSEEGTYHVSAMGFESNEFRIVLPYLKVNVGADGTSSNNNAQTIKVTGVTYDFDSKVYDYTLPIQSETKPNLSFVVSADGASEISGFINGGNVSSISSGKATSFSLKAGTNIINIIVCGNDSSVPKAYVYNVVRKAGIKTLALTDKNNNAIKLNTGFKTSTKEYSAKAVSGSKIKLNLTANDAENTKFTVNDDPLAETYTINDGENIFRVSAIATDNTQESKSDEYIIKIDGLKATGLEITVPEDSFLSLVDYNGIRVDNPNPERENGKEKYTFTSLAENHEYKWSVGKYGFISKTGKATITSDETDNLDITLIEATTPSSNIEAQWENFRNSDSNMAVVSYELPQTADETGLIWSQAAASQKYSPGTSLIVDNKLVYVSGKNLSLIDMKTGAVLKTVNMVETKGYGYMPPVYGGGMIYVALNNGIIQAFDAKSLESRWIYRNDIGGQALSAITYDQGYIYTGFSSNSSSKYNDFVCIFVGDEDVKSTDEEKTATWEYTHLGGFYWSGAYVTDKYVVVGADNKSLIVLDKKTGAEIDKEIVDGDIRCSISEFEGTLYFVTKGGSLYSASLAENGTITTTKIADIGGESTGTPAIANGYAYVGVKNKTIAQVKLSDGSLSTISVPNYSQSSMLINTYYEGKTILYFTCNCKPGGVEAVTVDNNTGQMSHSTIFAPEPAKENYSISSLICDKDGKMYYYNDSGNLFAIGKTSLQDKTYELMFSINSIDGKTIQDANVEVVSKNGNYASTFNDVDGKYTLSPGTYTYKISKDGYVSVTGVVDITNSNLNFTINLQEEQSSSVQPSEKTVSVQAIGYEGQGNISKNTLAFKEGMTALSVLQAVAGSKLEWKITGYGAYVVGIDGLSEFDKGSGSGWLYKVNGIYPSFSAGDYVLKAGDDVVWIYTTDLGKDVGAYVPGIESKQEVTTSGGVGGTTTAPTDVTVSGNIATATIKSDVASEIVKQAKENKAKEVVLEVAASDTKAADTIKLELPNNVLSTVAKDTSADLTVKTAQGEITLDNATLKQIAKDAKGASVSLEISKADKPTDAQKKLVGDNAQVYKLNVKSGANVISQFAGKVKVRIEIPASLKGKNVMVIHFDGAEKISKMSGEKVMVSGKEYYEFITTHFSEFALVDAEEVKLEEEETAPSIDDVKALLVKVEVSAKSTKTAKKNIKVTVSRDEETKSAIKELQDLGYTVKYRYYRSTKKSSKYELKKTTTKTSYTNTAGKKGQKYYYKVRVAVYDKDGKLVAQSTLKQCKYAARKWTK